MKYSIDQAIAEREDREPFEVEFGGELYTLPPRPDIRADAALADGRLEEGMRLLFGVDAWEAIKASPEVLDDAAFLDMYRAYQAHTGDPAGEDGASPSSSPSTVRPSKRTSRSSTPERI